MRTTSTPRSSPPTTPGAACRRARASSGSTLMAEDVTIEDPIGIGPTNPTGKGFRGKREAEQFWDKNLAPTQSVSITAHESFAAGNESAHVLTLTTTFPNGVKMSVHGIFTYTRERRAQDQGAARLLVDGGREDREAGLKRRGAI